MGEYADYELERGMDSCDYSWSLRSRRFKKWKKTCNRCGTKGLNWASHDGAWRLVDPRTGRLHTCSGRASSQPRNLSAREDFSDS